MRDIYANAHLVNIWLGNRREGDQQAIAFAVWLFETFCYKGQESKQKWDHQTLLKLEKEVPSRRIHLVGDHDDHVDDPFRIELLPPVID